jgi:hypothetical protein
LATASPGASLDVAKAAVGPAPVAASPAPTPDREREKDNLSGDDDRDGHQQSADWLSATLAGVHHTHNCGSMDGDSATLSSLADDLCC